jgi:hypothetical protein
MRNESRNCNIPTFYLSRDDEAWENAGGDDTEEIVASSPAQKIAIMLTRLVDRAAEALATATETGLSDGLEAACRKLADVLGELSSQLPCTPEQYQQLSSELQPLSAEEATCYDQGVDFNDAPGEDALQLVKAIKAALADAQQCLAEVPRAEIEELAGAALAAAQVGVVAARSAAGRLQQVADREAQGGSSVVIEELREEGDSTRERRRHLEGSGRPDQAIGSSSSHSSSSCQIIVHGRRFLWKPLWPRFRDWVAQPFVPTIVMTSVQSFVVERIVAHRTTLLVLMLFCWPITPFICFCIILAAIALLCLLSVLVPCVLFADAFLQFLYISWRVQIDALLEGGLRLTKLIYLSTRLTARQCARLVRIQLKRSLNGRSLSEVIQGSLHDPISSLTDLACFSIRTFTEIAGAVYTACISIAPLFRHPCSGWHSSSSGMGRQSSCSPDIVAR